MQRAQADAILALLSARMLKWLEDKTMNPDKIPMSRAALAFKARMEARGLATGRAEGKRESLLVLLGARGLSPTEAERATIEECTDPARLDGWIVKAATAASVGEVLAAKPRAEAGRRGAKRPKARA